MHVWVSAASGTVNKRSLGNIASAVIGQLDRTGEIAYLLRTEVTNGFTWHRFASDEREWWARGDVIHIATPPDHVLDVPFLHQSRNGALLRRNDCGPACTAMLLQHQGVNVTVDQLAIEIQPRPHAFTTIAQNTRAIERRGFIAKTRSLSMSAAMTMIRRATPFTALIEYSALRPHHRYGHFVVVVGIQNEEVVYHDPLVNAYERVDMADFARAWSQAGVNRNPSWRAYWINSPDQPE